MFRLGASILVAPNRGQTLNQSEEPLHQRTLVSCQCPEKGWPGNSSLCFQPGTHHRPAAIRMVGSVRTLKAVASVGVGDEGRGRAPGEGGSR